MVLNPSPAIYVFASISKTFTLQKHVYKIFLIKWKISYDSIVNGLMKRLKIYIITWYSGSIGILKLTCILAKDGKYLSYQNGEKK